MSIIDAAFKQSQSNNSTEQTHLAYQQTKQLAFYRKLSLGLAGVGLSVTFALAGFYSGQYLQQHSGSEHVVQQQTQGAVLSVDVQLQEGASENSQSPEQMSEQASQLLTDKTAADDKNEKNMIQAEEQYQWMSVQVGIDENGRPIFKQQLVPLSAVANMNNVPTTPATVANTSTPEVLAEDLSQYRVLGKPLDNNTQLNKQTGELSQTSVLQEDLSQYRILGKPLESDARASIEPSNEILAQNAQIEDNKLTEQATEAPLDDAAEKLKAAFELAVAETEDKDFTQAEPEQTENKKERLSIEFLPAKTLAAIGKLTYQAHIYSTSEHKRWIKINGVELYEGDKLNGMRLLEIAPEVSIFRFQGYDFEVKAMQDWQPY